MHILENNFREIYHSIKFPSKDPVPLVANYAGTRIYDSRYSLGIFWKKFYKLTDWMEQPNLLQDRLKKAVYYTNVLFHQEISNIRLPLKNYLEYLEKKGKGYNFKEEDFFHTRKLITRWNASTKPFLKLFENPSIKQSFCQSTGISSCSLLFHSTFNNELLACQKNIDLEGLINGPLPLQVFKKIIKEIPLNTIDQKHLKKWIVNIDKLNVEAKSVHKALKSLSGIYTKKKSPQKTIDESLIRLEIFLEDQGCTVFKKNDLKHLKWRQSLEKGKIIPFNDSTIILGNELFPALSGSDQTRAYAIEDQPDNIALIAQNRMALSLRDQRMRTDKHPDIEPILFSQISSDGRIAIVERLKPLNTLEWLCPNGSLSCEETSVVDSLALFIQKLITQNFTPLDFSSTSLMLDKKCQLKLVKPIIKGDFDFNAIEDFISECSAGNPIVFKELITKSGLIKHAIAKYYKDVVSNALNGDTITPDDLAGIYRISDPKVVDRAALLISQLTGMKNQLLLKLRKSSPNNLPKQLEAQANKILFDNYLQGNSLSKI